jgi:hypothetical protein
MKKITASEFWYLFLVAIIVLLIGNMGCNKHSYMSNGCPAGKEKKYSADPKQKFAYKKYTTQW